MIAGDQDTRAKRLWGIVQHVRDGYEPKVSARRPNAKDALIVGLLLETASDRENFRKWVEDNDALRHWTEQLTDEEIAYLVWLRRKETDQ